MKQSSQAVKWLRKASLNRKVPKATRAEARRVAKNLDAVAKHKAKKAQAVD